MRFLSNAHTHTRFCDGRNSPEEMVGAAERLGFVSLGFSGHGAQGFDPAYSMDGGRQEAYLSELRALQKARGARPRLWVGLEQDALTPPERKAENRRAFDYIIGSTHYLTRDFHGEPVPVDGDPALLTAYVREVLAGDMLAMTAAYFDAHVAMLLRDRPDIIGHFDLPRKNACAYQLFDERNPAYRRLALEALEKARACGGVLEVNTGGMARGYTKEAFPSRELLGAWREMGGAVTVTSDCHDMRLLDYGLEEAFAALKRLGYPSVLRLGTGDALWEAADC